MDEKEKSEITGDEPAITFELLALRYLDGLCNVEEARRLGEQLAASDEKRDQFVALCMQVGVIGEMGIATEPRDTGLDLELHAGGRSVSCAMPASFPDVCQTSGDDRGSLGHVLRGARQWLTASPWRIATLSTALALLVALALWLAPRQQAPLNAQREPQLIASLKNGAQAKWRDGLSLPDGTQFSEGHRLELAEGQAQVSFSCGAEVVMRAPCSVELTTPNTLLLREGLLCVRLADWTTGFTVATESVQILDLGKQFIVSADTKSGAVEAHAIDGKLRVQSKNVPVDKRYGLLVSQGEAIRIQPASGTPTRLKADGSLFNGSLDDSRPYKPIEINNTGRGLTPGDEDSHWRIVNSSADDFGRPRYAVVCRPYGNMYLLNDPAVSQWISISNPVDDNCPANTMYTFETEFDLTDYDLSTVTIGAQVIADNGVMAVRINGRNVPFKPWSAIYGLFDTYRKVEITEGFVKGVNHIQFDVWNSIVMRSPEARNPMALRVEWQAFGRLKQRDIARSDAHPALHALHRQVLNSSELQASPLKLLTDVR